MERIIVDFKTFNEGIVKYDNKRKQGDGMTAMGAKAIMVMDNIYSQNQKRIKRDEGVSISDLKFSQKERHGLPGDGIYLEGGLVCNGKFISLCVWEKYTNDGKLQYQLELLDEPDENYAYQRKFEDSFKKRYGNKSYSTMKDAFEDAAELIADYEYQYA